MRVACTLQLSSFVAVALALVACGGAPKPGGQLTLKPNDSGPPVGYAFDAGFRDVYEFNQGYASSYDLISEVEVPLPGKPMLAIDNLPAGATFDGKKLTWTPPCNEPDLKFYANQIGEAYVLVTLKSTIDPVQFAQRSPVLLVHQFPVMPQHNCGDPVWQPKSSGGAQ